MSILGIKKVKDQVLWCLENRPASRNCDSVLWVSVAYNFYPDELKVYGHNLNGLCRGGCDNMNMISAMKSLPDHESVRRCRQKIQNTDGLFLPTDPVVTQRRGIKEEAYREAFGKGTL